jgi:flavodoxin
MGGRTKKVAETIASGLSAYEVDFVPFELTGGKIEKLKKLDVLSNGDYSLFKDALQRLVAEPYDLILIGMPTYGNVPPEMFDTIMNRIQGLEGKDVVVFSTARITGSGTPEYMQAEVEKKGGEVIQSHNFRGLFRIGEKDVLEFADQISN